MIMNIKDRVLDFKSYNMDKTVLSQFKCIIENHLIWHSNR